MVHKIVPFIGSLGLVLLIIIAASPVATADFIDFSQAGPPGDFGGSTFTDDTTGLKVDGFYFNVTWLPANLYVRDEANDHGFGVCNPAESPCPGPSGGGDINELDNMEQNELIQLTLPDGYEWVSLQLSSLDQNGSGNSSNFERGELYADDGNLNNGLTGFLFNFVGDDNDVEPIFPIGFAATAPYLIFRPFDFTDGNDNNDFLVFGVTIQRTVAPEPGSLALLGAGLMAFGVLRRKR